MAESTNHKPRTTGQDSLLKFKAGDTVYEIPISNVSWSRDTETSTTQHNKSLKASRVVTGVRFSGSFEHDGRNYDAMNKLVNGSSVADGGTVTTESHEPIRGTLTVTETETGEDGSTTTYEYTFTDCIVTSTSRDVPSDDIASTSYDWEAEDMIVTKDGSKPENP